jgi:hypothetical protein
MSTKQEKNQFVDKSISLKLSLEDVNKIMAALSNLPYIQVYQLINKIQLQAGQQVVPEMENANSGNGQSKQIT